VSFADAEADLGRLLEKFGPPRHTSPGYPFHHLTTDGLCGPSGTVGDPCCFVMGEGTFSQATGVQATHSVRHAVGVLMVLIPSPTRRFVHGVGPAQTETNRRTGSDVRPPPPMIVNVDSSHNGRRWRYSTTSRPGEAQAR